MRKLEILFLVFVFLLALSIRLIYLTEITDSPIFSINLLKGIDTQTYVSWGRTIASGKWVGDEVFYMSPLFPYMLGVIFELCGENINTPCLVQVILGTLTCILIYGITRKIFGVAAACISSLISCFYGAFIFYTAVLLTETLAIFMISLALFSLVNTFETKRKKSFLLSGFLLGLSCLARPNFLVTALFLLLLILFRKRTKGDSPARTGDSRRVGLTLVFGAGLVLAILPVTVRNYVVSGRPVIISDQGLITFRIANSYDSVPLNFVYPKLPPMPVLSTAFWKHQLRKAVLFWYGYEVPQNVNYYLFMKYSKILRLPLFPFWLIAPLGLTGIAIALFRHRGSPVLYIFIACHYVSVVLFFIISRFRLPIMTALIPFAAFSIMTFYGQLRHRLYKKCCLHFISFIALMLLMIPWHTERIRANDYWMLAGLMREQGCIRMRQNS